MNLNGDFLKLLYHLQTKIKTISQGFFIVMIAEKSVQVKMLLQDLVFVINVGKLVGVDVLDFLCVLKFYLHL